MNANLISKQVEDYISYKKSLGYQIIVESQELRRFSDYTVSLGYKNSLTSRIAIQWASLNPNYSRWYMSRRLETVRTFAKYICIFDSKAEMPLNGVFGKCHGRKNPFIYTKKDILILMQAASKLHSPDGLRALTISTVLGLLWSTGMRPSEVCRLKIKDVDLTNGFIRIRETKFKKYRIIPIHTSVIDKLNDYIKIRNLIIASSSNDTFFITTGKSNLTIRKLEYAFQLIRKKLLIENIKTNERPPRLYDLRHTFTTNTLLKWLGQGKDVNHKMIYLSTYLGHVKVSDTYWYLTGIPKLLHLAVNKFENYFYQDGGVLDDKK